MADKQSLDRARALLMQARGAKAPPSALDAGPSSLENDPFFGTLRRRRDEVQPVPFEPPEMPLTVKAADLYDAYGPGPVAERLAREADAAEAAGRPEGTGHFIKRLGADALAAGANLAPYAVAPLPMMALQTGMALGEYARPYLGDNSIENQVQKELQPGLLPTLVDQVMPLPTLGRGMLAAAAPAAQALTGDVPDVMEAALREQARRPFSAAAELGGAALGVEALRPGMRRLGNVVVGRPGDPVARGFNEAFTELGAEMRQESDPAFYERPSTVRQGPQTRGELGPGALAMPPPAPRQGPQIRGELPPGPMQERPIGPVPVLPPVERTPNLVASEFRAATDPVRRGELWAELQAIVNREGPAGQEMRSPVPSVMPWSEQQPLQLERGPFQQPPGERLPRQRPAAPVTVPVDYDSAAALLRREQSMPRPDPVRVGELTAAVRDFSARENPVQGPSLPPPDYAPPAPKGKAKGKGKQATIPVFQQTVAPPVAAPPTAPAAAPAPAAKTSAPRVASKIPAERPVGKATVLRGAENLPNIEGRWRVVEADEVVTSHDLDMRPNKAFPADIGTQNRDLSADRSRLFFEQNFNNFEPARLMDASIVQEGAPTVGPDLVANAGNKRALMILRAYTEAGEKAQRYRASIEEQAPALGLDVAAIRKMQRPMLVRERTTELDSARLQQYAREWDAAATQSLSPAEKAQADARNIGQEELALLRPGALDAPQNRAFLQALIKKLPRGDQFDIADLQGNLNRGGYDRLRTALFTKVYGEENAARIAKLMAEDSSPNSSRVIQGLTDGLYGVARAKALVEAGVVPREYDLSPQLGKVLDRIGLLRRADRDIDQWVFMERAQARLPGEVAPMTSFELRLLEQLAGARSQSQIGKTLANYFEMVRELVPDARQADSAVVAGAAPKQAPPPPEAMWDAATRAAVADMTGQGDLLGGKRKPAEGELPGTAASSKVEQEAKALGVERDPRLEQRTARSLQSQRKLVAEQLEDSRRTGGDVEPLRKAIAQIDLELERRKNNRKPRKPPVDPDQRGALDVDLLNPLAWLRGGAGVVRGFQRWQFHQGLAWEKKVGKAAEDAFTKFTPESWQPALRRWFSDDAVNMSAPELAEAVMATRAAIHLSVEQAARIQRAFKGIPADTLRKIFDLREGEGGYLPPDDIARKLFTENRDLFDQFDELGKALSEVAPDLLPPKVFEENRGNYLPHYYPAGAIEALRRLAGGTFGKDGQSMARPSFKQNDARAARAVKAQLGQSSGALGRLRGRKLSYEEAKAKGLIQDVGYAMARGTIELTSLIEIRKLQNQIAASDSALLTRELDTIVNAADSPLLQEAGVDPATLADRVESAKAELAAIAAEGKARGWTRLHAGDNGRTYGPLEGAYVDPRVVADLKDITHTWSDLEKQHVALRIMMRAVAEWKRGKTAFSPGSAIGNILGNFIQADLGGMNPVDAVSHLAVAIADMRGERTLVQEAIRDGASVHTGFIDRATIDSLETFQAALADASNMAPASGTTLSLLTTARMVGAARKAASLASAASRGYNAIDAAFKLAHYKFARDTMGLSGKEAAERANRYHFDYFKAPTWVKGVNRYWHPFAMFGWKLPKLVLRSMAEHPLKAMKYAVALEAADALGDYLSSGEDDPQKRAQQRSNKPGGDEAFSVRMPWMSENQRPVDFQVLRILPILTMGRRDSDMQVPSSALELFSMTNPIGKAAVEFGTQRDVDTGKLLVGPGRDLGEAATEAVGHFVWDAAPTIMQDAARAYKVLTGEKTDGHDRHFLNWAVEYLTLTHELTDWEGRRGRTARFRGDVRDLRTELKREAMRGRGRDASATYYERMKRLAKAYAEDVRGD